MTDEPDNLVLSLLREIQASMRRMERRLDEFLYPVSSSETKLSQIHVDLAAHAARMDGMDARLDRIEKRLNLVDA